MDRSKHVNTYFVVEFVDGIQLVPHNWMIERNTKAYWPNFTNNMRYNKAVQEREPPQKSWQSFSIAKILATAQTYEKGKERLKEAELFSEVNSSDADEIQLKQRRRKRARVMANSSEESDVEDDTPYRLSHFPSPPTSVRRMSKAKATGETDNADMIVHDEANVVTELSSIPGPSLSKSQKTKIHVSKETITHDTLLNLEDDVYPRQPSTPKSPFPKQQSSLSQIASVATADVNTRNSQCLCEKGQSDTNDEASIIITSGFRDYQRFVIKNLTAIKMKVNQMSQTLQELEAQKQDLNLQKSCSESEVKIRSDIMKQFPLTDMVEVERVEKDLIDKKFKGHLMTALARIGGPDIKTRATRLMERLFSNCVAEKFSWIGGKKKLIFSNLLLCGVLLDVVRMQTPKATDDDISVPIKNWLRHAKERLDREKIRTSLVENIMTTDVNQDSRDIVTVTDTLTGTVTGTVTADTPITD